MSNVPEIESLKNKLTLERAKILEAVAAWSPDELEQPFLDGWSARDLLAHVAHAEAVNVKFAKLMLTHDRPAQLQAVAADYPDYVGPFELDRFNAYMTEKLRARSLDAVMRTLNETRTATLAWMDILTPEQLERKGIHAAWGEQNVRGMLKILILHDKMHAHDLVEHARQKLSDWKSPPEKG